MMEIYQIARPRVPWDTGGMAARVGKKADAEKRAQAIHARLMALRPAELSQNDWCKKAGVSTSFFSNLRGNSRGKRPSEPSIGNLRDVLEAIDWSLPEFFLEEARGRLVRAPNEQALAGLIGRLLPHLPSVEPDKRPEYLASTLLGVLALPSTMPANAANDYSPSEGGHAEGAPPRAPTRKAGSARRRS